VGPHFTDRVPSFGGPETEDAAATSGNDETLRQMNETANPVTMNVGERQHLLTLLNVPQFDASVT
jgi:hypothetical protein